jgi:hypothetical protein
MLTKLVEEATDASNINWESIANLLNNGVTASQCRFHWHEQHENTAVNSSTKYWSVAEVISRLKLFI